MKSAKTMKNISPTLFAIIISSIGLACFYSCQKAAPNPYSIPSSSPSKVISYPIFDASVNSGRSISFAPIKIIEGSYVTLKGVSPQYTVTVSLPLSDGPGGYSFDASSPGVRATLSNGTTTYVSDANVPNFGYFDITSITHEKYDATFSINARDSANTINPPVSVVGIISNM